jgi:LysM repeat protein
MAHGSIRREPEQHRETIQDFRQGHSEVNNLDASQPLIETAELVIPVGNQSVLGTAGSLATPGERHVVAKGETISLIARRYKVSTAQLTDWNNLDGGVIRVGQKLLVGPAKDDEPSIASDSSKTTKSSPTVRRIASTSVVPYDSKPTAKTPNTETGRLIHRVLRGESLSQIASNYNTSVEELRRANKHLGKVLQVGDPVYIPGSR